MKIYFFNTQTSEEQYNAFKEIAKRHHLPISALLRIAVERFIEDTKAGKPIIRGNKK